MPTASDDLDKIARLIKYVRELIALRIKPVLDISKYKHVLFVNDIPNEPECYVRTGLAGQNADEEILLEIQKPIVPPPPIAPEIFSSINELPFDFDDPQSLSSIADQAPLDLAKTKALLADVDIIPEEKHASVVEEFMSYVNLSLVPWAREWRRVERVRRIYSKFYKIMRLMEKQGEDYELLLGFGLLCYKKINNENKEKLIRRHLIVARISMEFNAQIGSIIVRGSENWPELQAELDMLAAGSPEQKNIEKECAALAEIDDPWNGELMAVARKISNHVSFDCVFSEGNEPSEVKKTMTLDWAPALICRKRSTQTVREALDSIAEGNNLDCFADFAELEAREGGEGVERDSKDHDLKDVHDQEVYFPRPTNEKQRAILGKVIRARRTLVQGPPGTGKSHTIANLISHFLAVGKRALITAHNARALASLAAHLPDEIRPLCVFDFGNREEERKSLESSISTILEKLDYWDESDAWRQIQKIETNLEKLRGEKASNDNRIRETREVESKPVSICDGAYRGTAGQIALQLKNERDKFNWLEDKVKCESPYPFDEVNFPELLTWLGKVTPEIIDEYSKLNVDPDSLPSVEKFCGAVKKDRETTSPKTKRDLKAEFDKLEARLLKSVAQTKSHPLNKSILDRIRERDMDGYAECLQQLVEFKATKEDHKRYLANMDLLRKHAQGLWKVLKERQVEEVWRFRLRELPKAWNWARGVAWLRSMLSKGDIELKSARQLVIESEISAQLERLASLRAWRETKKRATPNRIQNLKAWRQEIKRLGKGTGKKAAKHRKEAKKYLSDCKEMVPAWVMPIHRIWNSVKMERGAFDIIVVDEASQCGLEALPLLYLGKRMVIVGDDEQVSPESVGVNIDDVSRLQEQYLHDFHYASRWDERQSFFSISEMISDGSVIMLNEHFRCMPEIIQFSNGLCYDGKLIPLRQYGSARLDPLRRVRVENGYVEGDGPDIVNPPEVEAIVSKIAELCGKEEYLGKTMGVITLQGHAQAEMVEQELLNCLGLEEIKKRRIMCGAPPHFQGDERDVIFLSMVAATNKQIGALTKVADKQRFNVAASRAKDQLWLFHSVKREDLNPGCMRRKLLEYFEGSRREDSPASAMAEKLAEAKKVNRADPPKPPFDSWFEVDVAADIHKRGYVLTPQVKCAGKRIDLVVEGAKARMAVECDGDAFHGLDEYEADLSRQRMLERAGWSFFRVRGSAYYSNPEKALSALWEKLEEKGIVPGFENTLNDNVLEEEVYVPKKSLSDDETPQEPDDAKDIGGGLSSTAMASDQNHDTVSISTLPVGEQITEPSEPLHPAISSVTPESDNISTSDNAMPVTGSLPDMTGDVGVEVGNWIYIEVGDTVYYTSAKEPDTERCALIGYGVSNPDYGVINPNTPIAKALLGGREGEEVEVLLPHGKDFLVIKKIEKGYQATH